MPSAATPDFFAILELLHEHSVEFILVGGLCGVLHGAPIVTKDVDIVHRRDSENVARLLAALRAIDAEFRHHPSRITPRTSHFEGPGHSLLRTRLGDQRDYDELFDDTEVIDIDGRPLRILRLDALIDAKRRAGRDKDLVAIPVLEHTLALRSGDEES